MVFAPSGSRQDILVLQSGDGGERWASPACTHRRYSTPGPLDWAEEELDPVWDLFGVCESKLAFVCLALSFIIPPPPTASSWHMKLLWSPPSTPQGCVCVDGNTFLGCLHQYKLWMLCQHVEKSLKHPACLASSPFQPLAMSYWRTGLDAPRVYIQP